MLTDTCPHHMDIRLNAMLSWQGTPHVSTLLCVNESLVVLELSRVSLQGAGDGAHRKCSMMLSIQSINATPSLPALGRRRLMMMHHNCSSFVVVAAACNNNSSTSSSQATEYGSSIQRGPQIAPSPDGVTPRTCVWLFRG